MNIRLRFGSQRASVIVDPERPNSEATVGDVLDAAALKFHLDRESVRVSLNNDTFLDRSAADTSLAEWGVVAGDLIYVATPPEEVMEAPERRLSVEGAEGRSLRSSTIDSSSVYVTPRQSPPPPPAPSTGLPDTFHLLMASARPEAPLHCLALAVHSLFLNSYFRTPTATITPPDGWTDNEAVVRLPYVYNAPSVEAEQADVTVTLVDAGDFLSASSQVVFAEGRVSSFNVTLPMSDHVRRDSATHALRIICEDQLSITILNDLVNKIRQEIHLNFNLLPIGILRLPNELQIRLLTYLDAPALCSMERTCVMYKRLGRFGGVWRELLKRDFPNEYNRLSDLVKANTEHDWKVNYRQAYELKMRTELHRRRLLDYVGRGVPPVPWPYNVRGPDPVPTMWPEPPGMIGGSADLYPRFPPNMPF